MPNKNGCLNGWKIVTQVDRLLSKVFSLPADHNPEINDLRGLEAPEPMEIILRSGAQLGPDDVYLARLPHHPFPLLPILAERGFTWQTHEEEDGCVLILIRRPS